MKRSPLTIFIPHCSDLLTDHLPHGDGIVAHGFIRRLAERGHILYIVAERVELKQALPANVHITIVSPKGTNKAMARLRYMWAMRVHFRALSRSTRLDVVHQLNPVFAGMSLAVAPTPLPVVLGTYVPRWSNIVGPAGQSHGDPETLSSGLGLRGRVALFVRDAVCRLQQRHADLLLLVSRASYDRLPDRATVEAKVRWLAHGVDTEIFSPGAETAVEASPSILFLASVVKRKGIFTLLEAMPAVAARIPAVRLTVAGDGVDGDAARRFVAEHQLGEHVTFVGRVEREQAPAFYRSHRVYCLPSFGEPYATSILEAMSCGCAIVLADSGGLSDMVPEEGGLRFATGDPASLAAALIALLEEPTRCAAMGAVNRERVLEAFAWPGIIDRLEDVYYEAMELRAARVATSRGAAR